MNTPPPTPVELSQYLKCLVQDLYLLANATEGMAEAKSEEQADVNKAMALVKLRTVYDFFHRPGATDSIKVALFDGYSPVKPKSRPKEWDMWLTHQSVNTYVTHLDKERITGQIPQPKFGRGERVVLATALEFMRDAKEFVDSLTGQLPPFDAFGRRWQLSFANALARLEIEVKVSQWQTPPQPVSPGS